MAEPELRFGKNITPNLWSCVLAVVKPPFRNWPQDLTGRGRGSWYVDTSLVPFRIRKIEHAVGQNFPKGGSYRRGDGYPSLPVANGNNTMLTPASAPSQLFRVSHPNPPPFIVPSYIGKM